MITTLILPAQLRAQLGSAAQDAFPGECCGLIEGMVDGATTRATQLHAMPNVAQEHDRFEIDPAAQIALLRRLREGARRIIGCYHSHPNGRAEPSERDRASAVEEGFLWVIAALDARASDAPRIAAFVSTGCAFSPLRVAARLLDRAAAAPL